MISGENFPTCLPPAIPVMMATMSFGTGVDAGVLSHSRFHQWCSGGPSSFTGLYFLRRWRRQRHRSRRNPSSPVMAKATASGSQTVLAGEDDGEVERLCLGPRELGVFFLFCLCIEINICILIRMLHHGEKGAGLAKIIVKFAQGQGSWVRILGGLRFLELKFFLCQLGRCCRATLE